LPLIAAATKEFAVAERPADCEGSCAIRVFLLGKPGTYRVVSDTAARRHAYDSIIKRPFATNRAQRYRIRLQR
jgi:hypothetical protein